MLFKYTQRRPEPKAMRYMPRVRRRLLNLLTLLSLLLPLCRDRSLLGLRMIDDGPAGRSVLQARQRGTRRCQELMLQFDGTSGHHLGGARTCPLPVITFPRPLVR